MEEIRLQKYLAEAGIASRRKCEEYITDGRIKVNGKIINELGTKVNPEKDEIFGGNITDRALLSFVQNKKSNVRKCKLNLYNIYEKLKKHKWQKDKIQKLEK